MRPITRGTAPQVYARYEDAKQDLVNRLGCYCSYCERRIATLLAVEHIQPKARPEYAHLEKVWDNFLLGCVNCNSAKSKKPVDLGSCLMPDLGGRAAPCAVCDPDVSPDIPCQIPVQARTAKEVKEETSEEHRTSNIERRSEERREASGGRRGSRLRETAATDIC